MSNNSVTQLLILHNYTASFQFSGHYVNAAPQVALLVGGHNADVNEYPWHVMITYEIFFLCSGSILDEYTILTAAHCLVHDPQQMYVRHTSD